jgi:hypothetical protein
VNGRKGHSADIFTHFSGMSAVGGIADAILLIFQRFELPVSARSGHSQIQQFDFHAGYNQYDIILSIKMYIQE